VTLHGVTISAGRRVLLVYGTANRDERQFPDPDRFDVKRGRVRHLCFGEGMHGCLGAPLARLEVKVAAEEALPVLDDYTISGPPVRYRPTALGSNDGETPFCHGTDFSAPLPLRFLLADIR
jgi:cytochrome P450